MKSGFFKKIKLFRLQAVSRLNLMLMCLKFDLKQQADIGLRVKIKASGLPGPAGFRGFSKPGRG
jgi:hypothetical protein